MKKVSKLLLAALALSAAVSGQPASAKIVEFAKSGYWHAYGGVNDDGKALCGMYTNWYRSDADRAAGRAGKSVHIKWVVNGPGLIVYAFKDTWRIPEGTKVDVEFGFDKDRFAGVSQTDGDMMKGSNFQMGLVSFHIADRGMIANFLEEFARADMMWLKFPTGNEAPWTMDMVGSREISKQFSWCVGQLRPSTQPYSNPPSSGTQPFEQKLPTPTLERGA